MNEKNKNALIIFARYPEKGKVKTRLAKATGDEFATTFYKLCAEYTFNIAEQLNTTNVDNYLFFSEKEETQKIKNWVGMNFKLYQQSGNDLGERMYNAFQKVIDEGSNKTIIIGTDAPEIKNDIISEAFSELDNVSYVIGPSNDGGYYLIGAINPDKDLFANISWSSNSVLTETINKLKQKQYNFKLLKQLTDIDTEDDLKNWFAENKSANSHLVNYVRQNYTKKI